jgi:hypothetical protein
MDSQKVHERYQAGKRNFEGVDLHGAHLNAFDLREVSLRQADLSGANLSDTNFSQADLKGANLRGANLRHAYLNNANLHLVDLRGADLRGASLDGADLRGANLIGTMVDKDTTMSARWRQIWELANPYDEGPANRLEIETRITPEGGVRAEILIDGNPLVGPHLQVDLHSLASSLHGSGEYWIITCSCGDPGCSGITQGVSVFWDGSQVHWVILQPGPERALVFEGDAYREAIKKGLGDFVDSCRQHPGGLVDRMGNYNYFLINVDLDALLGGA